MKFGSLFTGIGGFDLGFERAGLECAWQVEIDDACQNVERRHWPSVKRFGDVQNVGRDSLDSVDLICGGFPCQDVSVAGKRAGLAGERSGLWYEFHRILEELKPQWVVIENVPGLLSSEDGRDFAAILQGLVQLRYGVAWRVLDAQYFGVAQRRRRVFVVGSLGDGRAAQVLFEREGGAGDTPPSREAGARLAATIASRFAGASNQWPPINEADNLIAWDNGQGDPNADHDGTAFALNGQANQGVAYTLPASARGTGDGHGNGWNSNYIINSFKKRGGFGWSQDEGIAQTLESEGGTHQGGPERIPLLIPPLRAGGGVTSQPTLNKNLTDLDFLVNQPLGVRRLTPVECERLQGFPDDWTAWGVDESGKRVNQSDSTRYRQLGNAVCEPVAEWIGQRLYDSSHR